MPNLNTKGEKHMTKVVRIPLISRTEKDGKEMDYKDICHILWDLQRETRDIKNRAVQLCWEWQGFSSDYKKDYDQWPKDVEHLTKINNKTGEVKGYTLSGFIYDQVKNCNLYSANCSTSSMETIKAFNNVKKEMLKGERSILSYKSNQPLDLHNKAIQIFFDEDKRKFFVHLSLLNSKGKAKYNINTPFIFEMTIKSRSQRVIVERCIDGMYKISGSKLLYVEKKNKKQWCLNLSYSFEGKECKSNKENILGVNIGVFNSITASVYGDKDRLVIEGGEVEAFRSKVEARRTSMKHQRTICENGSIGHGYHTRVKPVLDVSDKIARFRDTYNHKMSRTIVDYAERKECGTIQMEDLKGIANDKNPVLKNWSYFDLQQKIKNKAAEKGIDVVIVERKYMSQRCPKCGHIDINRDPTSKSFECPECNYKTKSADYATSQNLAIKDIDKIIAEVSKEIEKEKKKMEREKKKAEKNIDKKTKIKKS